MNPLSPNATPICACPACISEDDLLELQAEFQSDASHYTELAGGIGVVVNLGGKTVLIGTGASDLDMITLPLQARSEQEGDIAVIFNGSRVTGGYLERIDEKRKGRVLRATEQVLLNQQDDRQPNMHDVEAVRWIAGRS